ncbi:MAG TPA: Hpt domain-containing protein [Gemmatimonadaceae bacterium]|nr:Hpt domain-containing protein [Gemmatimonadaceae bacterium]
MTSEPSKALAQSGEPIYDDAALLTLAMDDRELANELVRLFLADVPSHLAGLSTAIGANDARGVESAAHALKGSAATVTAARVAAAAQALETKGAAGDLADASRLFEMLKASLGELNTRLTAL